MLTSQPPSPGWIQGSLLARFLHDERIHAETDGQVDSVVQLNQCFKDLGVVAVGGLIGAHFPAPQLLTNADYMSREAPSPVGICGNIRGLAEGQLADVRLIDINTHA